MKKLILLVFVALALSVPAFAHEAFTLVSSEKITATEAQLAQLQKQASVGKVDGQTLTFADSDVKLVVVTGPEDDMLSFRIQGIRNPTIVTPPDAKLTVWFINIDGDMSHDIRFAHYPADFVAKPDIKNSVGTERLSPRANENAAYSGEKIVFASLEDGAYKYFCSVGSHAKGGMWGNILIGVKPSNSLKTPVKTEHAHSPDEDKMPGMDMNKDKDPKKKPQEMSDMPGMKKDDDMANMPGMKKDDKMSDMPGMKKDDKMPAMKDMDHGSGSAMNMSSTVNIGDPMHREGSGTSWAPDSTPMYAKMKMGENGSMWMFMGTGFLRYTQIGSSRDVSAAGKGSRSRFDAPTMFMAMYSHPIGKKGQFGFRAMASLDPIIEQGYGYPLLYQSGEQYRRKALHDRQHPHDLISELAVTYSYKFDDKRSFYLYAGYPGEPALGPPMYLHRNSGMNIPDAPIGHHWQDATHITYGVVTAGFSFGKAKIEASAFNGTEPNENRWNFDKPNLNSYSARFSFNPTKDWAFQISHGYLRNPEPLEPNVRILRKTTASAIYNKAFDHDHNLSSTFVWGMNHTNGESTNAFLFESNYDFFKNAVFGRAETVQKTGHDLVLNPIDEHKILRVNAFSIGYIRDLVRDKGIDVGLGTMFTLNTNGATLAPYYGGTTHGGWQVFMRFRPSRAH